MNPDLPHRLAERLQQPLPGPMVGSRFALRPPHERHDDRPLAAARPAAVLILLYPRTPESACGAGPEWHVPLIVRSAGPEPHAGQVSLPGGAVESGESSRDAALREFCEEVCPRGDAHVTIHGPLTPVYVRVSNYLVTPWLGTAPGPFSIEPSPIEVQEVLEVPLGHLMDAAHFGHHERTREGEPYLAPHFLFRDHRIWGATCMILGELVTLIEQSRIEV
jgi:8-oxo-dGTP pyrophosphatase MutT (NUDIX family)